MAFDQPASSDSSDRLIFSEELAPARSAASSETNANVGSPWKILLVDDEPAIHQATKVALKFFTFEGRPLRFLSAYSAKEAEQHIQNHPDVVLILLDVIMETHDAGLRVAQYIRQTLENKTVRIVLCTGQPGQVPEESVVLDYDINDYKTKLELTQKKLFTTLVSSLRAYRDLLALEQSKTALSQLNTRLKQLNQSLEKRVAARTQTLTQEVKEREKAQEALKLHIHALTHDLRNPVTGMTSVLQSLIEKDAIGNPPTIEIPERVLTRMKKGCDRQLSMINALLETYDIEIWGVKLRQEPFDFEPFMAEILETWQPNFEKKRVSLNLHMPSSLPLVNGDRTHLWRVFENLFDNAIKYNPPEITLSLYIDQASQPDSHQTDDDSQPSRPSQAFIHCTLCDDGIGIPAAQSAVIFQRYQRGQSTSPTRGLGLGLYVCRRIIEAHGGTIGLNSPIKNHPDALTPQGDHARQGSEFWFTLPAAPAP
ncbi:MAG: hybrid sensor histidine kinase/response regulator [Cyanobacteria bacterium J06627_28]